MTGRLEGRLIGLGVTGSIAAYKAVELLRLLRAEGADVVAMLTPAATAFVGPLTFASLSRHPVETDVLALLPDGRISHIVVADTADALVVAPATAHWLGAMAHGLSGDVVTATALATSAPVVVAPAMDGDMWTHPATKANVARLRDEFGYAIVEPETGELASGQSGVGRLADLPTIVDAVVGAIGSRPVRAPDVAARPPLVDAREPDLVGRPVPTQAAAPAGPPATVEGLGAFADVRPASGEVPALVAGRPPPGTPAGTLLALALNGRVATVAEVAPEGRDGTLRFAGLLPGGWFVPGPNRLEVLVVEDGGGLRRLPVAGG